MLYFHLICLWQISIVEACYIFNLPKAVPKYIYSKLYLSYSLNYSSPHLHCQMSIAPLRGRVL